MYSMGLAWSAYSITRLGCRGHGSSGVHEMGHLLNMQDIDKADL